MQYNVKNKQKQLTSVGCQHGQGITRSDSIQNQLCILFDWLSFTLSISWALGAFRFSVEGTVVRQMGSKIWPNCEIRGKSTKFGTRIEKKTYRTILAIDSPGIYPIIVVITRLR